MALENWLKPDILDGDNQYFCEPHNKKVDAEKGLELKACPQILCCSLNRFTLDYNTFMRVKVQERVSFPLILNLNDYMKGYEGIENKLYDKEVDLVQQYDKKQIEDNLKAQEVKEKALQDRKNQSANRENEERPSVIAAKKADRGGVKIEVKQPVEDTVDIEKGKPDVS